MAKLVMLENNPAKDHAVFIWENSKAKRSFKVFCSVLNQYAEDIRSGIFDVKLTTAVINHPLSRKTHEEKLSILQKFLTFMKVGSSGVT